MTTDTAVPAVRSLDALRSLHELVLERLRDEIVEGNLVPGMRLKVRDLADQLGVSSMTGVGVFQKLCSIKRGVRQDA